MKILYTNFHPGDGGGHTTYLCSLLVGLSASHALTVACPAKSKLNRLAREIPGVEVVDVDFPGRVSEISAILRNVKLLRQCLKQGKFDVVHVNGSPDHRLISWARLGGGFGEAIVLTKHNHLPVRRGMDQNWRAKHHTDAVIVVAEAVLPQLRGTPYFHKATVVRNGVDLTRFSPVDAAARAAARTLYFPEAAADDLILVSVAGTAWHKGWLTLIAARAQLAAESQTKIWIALAGKPRQTSAIAKRLGWDVAQVDSQIRFVGALSDVRPFVAAGDVGFVLSYDVETISFACREMMAMGKPVLLSRYAGLPENITPDVEGWLISPQDVAACAGVLERLLREKSDLDAWGHRARLRAEAAFGMAAFLQSTLAVYQSVTQARQPASH